MDQYYYTGCREGQGISGIRGFDVRAITPGLSSTIVNELGLDATYTLQTYLQPYANQLDPKAFPVRLAYLHTNGGQTIIAHNVYLGRDASTNRQGNVFDHVLLNMPPETDAMDAIATWGSPEWCWKDNDGPTALPELSNLPRHGTLNRKIIPRMLEQERLTRVFRFCLETIRNSPEHQTIYIAGQSTEVVWLIYALAYSHPKRLRKKLTFSTFEGQPETIRARLIGTSYTPVPDYDIEQFSAEFNMMVTRQRGICVDLYGDEIPTVNTGRFTKAVVASFAAGDFDQHDTLLRVLDLSQGISDEHVDLTIRLINPDMDFGQLSGTDWEFALGHPLIGPSVLENSSATETLAKALLAQRDIRGAITSQLKHLGKNNAKHLTKLCDQLSGLAVSSFSDGLENWTAVVMDQILINLVGETAAWQNIFTKYAATAPRPSGFKQPRAADIATLLRAWFPIREVSQSPDFIVILRRWASFDFGGFADEDWYVLLEHQTFLYALFAGKRNVSELARRLVSDRNFRQSAFTSILRIKGKAQDPLEHLAREITSRVLDQVWAGAAEWQSDVAEALLNPIVGRDQASTMLLLGALERTSTMKSPPRSISMRVELLLTCASSKGVSGIPQWSRLVRKWLHSDLERLEARLWCRLLDSAVLRGSIFELAATNKMLLLKITGDREFATTFMPSLAKVTQRHREMTKQLCRQLRVHVFGLVYGQITGVELTKKIEQILVPLYGDSTTWKALRDFCSKEEIKSSGSRRPLGPVRFELISRWARYDKTEHSPTFSNLRERWLCDAGISPLPLLVSNYDAGLKVATAKVHLEEGTRFVSEVLGALAHDSSLFYSLIRELALDDRHAPALSTLLESARLSADLENRLVRFLLETPRITRIAAESCLQTLEVRMLDENLTRFLRSSFEDLASRWPNSVALAKIYARYGHGLSNEDLFERDTLETLEMLVRRFEKGEAQYDLSNQCFFARYLREPCFDKPRTNAFGEACRSLQISADRRHVEWCVRRFVARVGAADELRRLISTLYGCFDTTALRLLGDFLRHGSFDETLRRSASRSMAFLEVALSSDDLASFRSTSGHIRVEEEKMLDKHLFQFYESLDVPYQTLDDYAKRSRLPRAVRHGLHNLEQRLIESRSLKGRFRKMGKRVRRIVFRYGLIFVLVVAATTIATYAFLAFHPAEMPDWVLSTSPTDPGQEGVDTDVSEPVVESSYSDHLEFKELSDR